MSRRVLFLLVPILVAGSFVVASKAGATRDDFTVIRVIEHADTDTTTDTGATGDSVGDVLTFANPLFDASDATKVGTDQGYCVRVVAGTSYECTWTAFLPRGQIVVNGPFFDAADSTLAITGGTGAYRGAHGTMKLHARPGGTSYDFTYRIKG